MDPEISNIRYVGITKQELRWRLQGHLGNARFGQDTPVNDWIRELLSADRKPIITLIEQTEERARERYWIAIFKANGFDLLNLEPGIKQRGIPLSDDHRAAISKGHIGLPRSATHCANLSKSKTGHIVSAETKAKIGNANRKSIKR